MKKEAFKNFIEKIGNSLNPEAYKKISQNKLKSTIGFFFLFLVFAIIVMQLVSIPNYINLSKDLNHELDKIDEFKLNIDFSTNEEILLLKNYPFLKINTLQEFNETPNLDKGSYLITNKTIYSKGIFGKINEKSLSELKDLSDNQKEINTLFTIIILFAIPSLIIISYLFFAIKYIILILMSFLITLIILRILKQSISSKEIINIIIHAITILIFLEVVLLPLSIRRYIFPVNIISGINISLLGLGVFIFYIIAGIVQNSSKF